MFQCCIIKGGEIDVRYADKVDSGDVDLGVVWAPSQRGA